MEAESQAAVSCMLHSCIGILKTDTLRTQYGDASRPGMDNSICDLDWRLQLALTRLVLHVCFMPSDSANNLTNSLLPLPTKRTLPCHDFV